MSALLDNALAARTKYGLLVIASLVAIYLTLNFVTGPIIGGFFGSYVLPFLLWGMLALAVFYLLPKARPVTRSRNRSMLNWAAFLSALAFIVTVYGVGLLEGYGRSPYNQSFRGIIINIFILARCW